MGSLLCSLCIVPWLFGAAPIQFGQQTTASNSAQCCLPGYSVCDHCAVCFSITTIFLVPGRLITQGTCRSATKAVLAAQCVGQHGLDIQVPGSDATIDVWYLYITLIMGAVFGFAEHSLCVAWAATFRGESWIEMSQYRSRLSGDFRRRSMGSPNREPLLPYSANVSPGLDSQDSPRTQAALLQWDPLQ